MTCGVSSNDLQMTLYGEGIQTYAAMFDGFAAAAERFLKATEREDPTDSYVALFEALNWAVVLDVRTKELWAPRGRDRQPGWGWRDEVEGAGVLRGIRFARNAMHHDWAEVLELADVGRAYPKRFPAGYREWVWREIATLPQHGRKDPEGQAVYIGELAGHPVRHSLVGLHGGFAFLRSVLEPSSLIAPRATEGN